MFLLNGKCAILHEKGSVCVTVGEKIRSSRVNAGLTQKELGDKMGVDSATVGKYERGILNPKLQTLEKIAAALGVTIWELGAVNSAEYRQVMIDREINKSRERHDEDTKLHQLEIEFRKLNAIGQEKALERICELTEIARFLKEKTPPGEMVWCGPSIPPLMQQATIFTGILPEDVKEFLGKHPGAGALFVPVDQMDEVLAKLGKKYNDGESVPREKVCYDKLKSEIGDTPLGTKYKYCRYQTCNTMPAAGDTSEDTNTEND